MFGGVSMGKEPAHVGLIPDGLRRWADAHGATLHEAYLRGAEKVAEILLALQQNDVQTVTVYNLSRANLARPDDQLDAVYAASLHFLTTLVPDNFDPTTCTFTLHGDRNLLPDKFVAAARDLESTMTGDDFRINLLAAYDAHDELHAAYLRAQRDHSDIGDALTSERSTSSSGPLPSHCSAGSCRFRLSALSCCSCRRRSTTSMRAHRPVHRRLSATLRSFADGEP